ncbi:MAG: [FeFe] hydrogenase H-cluster maturation GTPase HydF [Roseburia sp.]|nr:[FeFe] hydrogenase H-cluster maturation GTPase HydF [Roseburia sp.]
MGLNDTPTAERTHIGIFGRRNAGKSSLLNAITGQNLAIVSGQKGTTTDPVSKSMELLPLGPVVFIDTPGLDDEGDMGELRVKKSYQVLNKTDIGLLVVDGECLLHGREGDFGETEKPILKEFVKREIPYIIVVNKEEMLSDGEREKALQITGEPENTVFVSAVNKTNIEELKKRIAQRKPEDKAPGKLVGDLLEPGDLAVLVVPIDASAPKGRLILPQQQVIRDCLEAGAIPVTVRETELQRALDVLKRTPRLVITDSQVFDQVDRILPRDISLTSFSILLARYKGNLKSQAEGAKAIDRLKEGDKVLIAESCTHHRQCEDIGTVKLPKWLKNHTKKNLDLTFSSGTEFPEDLSEYSLVIHCGGCMVNEREMKYRLNCAENANVPMTNYGAAIAHMHGILERAIEIFHL